MNSIWIDHEIEGHLKICNAPCGTNNSIGIETGETFVVYTTRMKMEKAKELIDQTASTVEELAEKLGYENKSYFLKCFKNFTGLTPSEYAGKIK